MSEPRWRNLLEGACARPEWMEVGQGASGSDQTDSARPARGHPIIDGAGPGMDARRGRRWQRSAAVGYLHGRRDSTAPPRPATGAGSAVTGVTGSPRSGEALFPWWCDDYHGIRRWTGSTPEASRAGAAWNAGSSTDVVAPLDWPGVPAGYRATLVGPAKRWRATGPASSGSSERGQFRVPPPASSPQRGHAAASRGGWVGCSLAVLEDGTRAGRTAGRGRQDSACKSWRHRHRCDGGHHRVTRRPRARHAATPGYRGPGAPDRRSGHGAQ